MFNSMTNGMLGIMPKVEKVTVSLPASLLAFIERQRARTGSTRSETVVGMLREAQHRIERADREARYAASYGRQQETTAERAFTDAAAAKLFADVGNEWADVASSSGRPPVRRSGDHKETTHTRARTAVRKAAPRKASSRVVDKAAKRATR